MGSSRSWLGAVLILSVSVVSTAVVGQAVLANRSFEGGTDPGEAMVLAPGSTAIEGWTVVGGNISYVGRKWQHAQGLRSVALLCGGGISQTLDTEPDQDYEIRFSMAGDPAAVPALKTLIVLFGNEKRVFTFDTTGRTPADMGWAARSWVFRAVDKPTTLTFQSPAAECSVPALDGVRIEAVEIGVRARPGMPERIAPIRSGP